VLEAGAFTKQNQLGAFDVAKTALRKKRQKK
jgi:hypothetical protein